MSETTKECPYCFSEIDARARKCPNCQSFQKPSHNPQFWAAILPIVFLIPFLYFTFSKMDVFTDDKKYEDYVDQFRVELVVVTSDTKGAEATYRIVNESDVKWEGIHYQLIGRETGGGIVTTVTDQNRDWVILPLGEALLTAKVNGHPNIKQWELKILDSREARRF